MWFGKKYIFEKQQQVCCIVTDDKTNEIDSKVDDND